MKKLDNKSLVFVLIGVYFIANLFFLDKFPFMHSDESWLAGLTRAMFDDGLGATETFFDLLPRFPHAIKTLFHIMQMPLILIFGYNLFAVRLLSLLFGCAVIFISYRITLELTKSITFSLLTSFLLALDIQFLYASHFARQEIIILFGISLALLYFIKNIETWNFKKDIVISSVIGLMIGIHPNAFIAALVVFSIYFYYIFFEKKVKFQNLLMFISVVFAFAVIFIGISYLFDGNFISHYLQYGENLGVTSNLWQKIKAIIPFYQKLWLGITGTYYLPNIRPQMILFGISIIASVIFSFHDRKVLLFLLPVIAINIGYIIIGRYSQPSIIFSLFMCWMLVFYLLNAMKRIKKVVIAFLLASTILTSAFQVSYYINNDYDEYIQIIIKNIPEGSKVLGNLNTDFAFENNQLLDYRNLEYLLDCDMTFSEYLKSNEIEYIIYPEEMDYIYENRPVWNILYGNEYPYYDDMQTFLKENCIEVYTFSSKYAMRIASLMNTKDWTVIIYKVEYR